MRSLACVRHHDWTGTVNQIIHDGGKAAEGELSPSPRPVFR
jgi:hypothetical protein